MALTKTTKPNYKINRETHTIDATDRPVGRVATEVVKLLIGKHKPDYTPHVDNGDFVTVSNIKHIRFTGKKLEQKKYYRHSLYPGGLKTTKASTLMKQSPEKILQKAVYSMLPKTKHRSAMIKRLKLNA